MKALEEGSIRTINKDRALRLTGVLNAYISSIIDGDPKFSLESIHFGALMNFGTQVNGSWRNEIGKEGTRRVKEFILTHFIEKNLVKEIITKDETISPPVKIVPPIDNVQTFTVKNGYKIAFASEPDISIIDPSGSLGGAVEIKAGIDPAGALERYGAAKKSFDKALRENKACTTVYLASCITEGVKKVMVDDRLVKQDFNLTKIFVAESARNEFLQYVQWLMHL